VQVARDAHEHGVYLMGRLVTFEDPVVAEQRPSLAIRTSGGGVWHNRAGLGWANPYARGYWRYAVDAAAAKAGFDEIQFDYVRFPTDGDTSQAVFRGRAREPQAVTIARFLRLDDPNAAPGKTVTAALRDFNRALKGRRVLLVPWLQDFSLGRTYGPAEVQQQIDAARRAGAAGFMLWNAEGLYTLDVLRAS
jgi:hypothetical protein